jgi:hypothetical protein
MLRQQVSSAVVLLTAAAVLFVAVDIRTPPESTVLKWGFVLVTALNRPERRARAFAPNTMAKAALGLAP